MELAALHAGKLIIQSGIFTENTRTLTGPLQILTFAGYPIPISFRGGDPRLCPPVVQPCSSRVPIVLGARDAGVRVAPVFHPVPPARTPDPPGSAASRPASVGRDVVCPPLRLSPGKSGSQPGWARIGISNADKAPLVFNPGDGEVRKVLLAE